MNWKSTTIIILKCHLLLLYTTMNHFLNVMNMTFNEKWIEHDNCNDRLRDWIKKKKKLQSTCQSQTCMEKKKSHGHCLMVCCPSVPPQFSISQQNHYIWEVCSANRWDALKTSTPVPAVCIGQQKGPHSSPRQCLTTSHNQCFKSWTNWTIKFCLIFQIHLTSHQLTTTSLSI